MYASFARALSAGSPGDFPTGTDGLIATRIAEVATSEAIARRARLMASIPDGRGDFQV